MEVVKYLLLIVLVHGQLTTVSGQPTEVEEHGQGRIEREQKMTSRLMQQLESTVTVLMNDKFDRLEESWKQKFDGLEHKMNNFVQTLNEVKQKQIEASEEIKIEFENTAMTSQSNHAAHLDKIESVVAAIQSANENCKQFCFNNFTSQLEIFSEEHRRKSAGQYLYFFTIREWYQFNYFQL